MLKSLISYDVVNSMEFMRLPAYIYKVFPGKLIIVNENVTRQ